VTEDKGYVVNDVDPDEPSHRFTMFLADLCSKAMAQGLGLDAIGNSLTSAFVNIAFHNGVPAEHVAERLHRLAELMPRIYQDMRLINMDVQGSA